MYQCDSKCVQGDGKQCVSNIQSEGSIEKLTEPGVQFIVFKHETGQQLYKVTFNFLSKLVKKERLKQFFNAIPDDAVVVIVVNKRCKADIQGWFDLLLLHSNLVRLNGDSTEPDLLVTCQKQCKPGVLATSTLPFYRYREEAFAGVIQEDFQLLLGEFSFVKI